MRSWREVERCRQVEVVQLLEVLAQRGVDLSLGRLGLEQIAVANAALLGELHRQQQQRRRDPLFAVALEVVPAQERDDQPELRLPVLLPVAPRLRQDGVEDPVRVRRVLPAHTEPSDTGRPDRTCLGDLGVPGEQLLGPDVASVEQERHGCLGEVERLRARPEPDEPVATRQVEQPVAKGREHGAADILFRALGDDRWRSKSSG